MLGPPVPGIGERAHTVAGAGSGVEIDEARFTRRMGVSIGHVHRNALMQTEEMAEIRWKILQERQLVRSGIAEDRGEGCDRLHLDVR